MSYIFVLKGLSAPSPSNSLGHSQPSDTIQGSRATCGSPSNIRHVTQGSANVNIDRIMSTPLGRGGLTLLPLASLVGNWVSQVFANSAKSNIVVIMDDDIGMWDIGVAKALSLVLSGASRQRGRYDDI